MSDFQDVSIDPAISSSMQELGITQNHLDDGELPEVESDSKDAEGDKPEEASENEASEEVEDGKEAVDSVSNTEGEENQEAPIEEPKLTAEEFQKIETERTQLEVERKAFTEERQRIEAEFQEKYAEKLKTHDEIDAFFVDLEAKDPDLYSLVKSAFQDHAKQFNNPQVAALRNEMTSIKAELESFKSNASAEVTLSKLDTDLSKLQSTLGKEAEAAGLKIDYDKVKARWAKNPDLSLEEAAFAVYGPALIKASASKAKVEAVEKKVQSRPAVKTAGTANATKSSDGPDFKKMGTEGTVHWFARQFGKA